MIGNVFDDALRDNRRSPVPVQVQFRLDFGRWQASLPRRRQAVLDVLATSERAADVAAAFGLSPGRVSQLRREFRDVTTSDWPVWIVPNTMQSATCR